MMKRYFNIAGPCWPNKHYMLPALARCQGVVRLIEREQYFVIHAAHQSGKTTLLIELTKQLNAEGTYHVLYCSLESAEKIVDAEKGIPAVVDSLRSQISLHPQLRQYQFAETTFYFNTLLRMSLTHFCENLDKPLIILFDEIDCLANGTLISFLRQIREGYVNRQLTPFVHVVGLIGMRNIRDYKARVREEHETLGSASPFNIVTEALTLHDFTQEEIAALYAQHTADTGQVFPDDVVERVYHYTNGQPWLVNAIARHIVFKILGNDTSQPILADYVDEAAQTIIKQRPTHIDSLMKSLKETRVQRIVEPLLLGEARGYSTLDDDYQYVLDLGLLREDGPELLPSNRVYGEVMIRWLSSATQMELERQGTIPQAPAYLVDGKLDMKRLLGNFQVFWRENSEIWIERYQYKEAAPHLVLHAFLQRVINAGGTIHREVASGRGRLDICIEYGDRHYRYPIELKIRRDTKTVAEGQTQLADYMERLGCDEGWLIVFDTRKTVSWEEKLFWQTDTINGKMVHTVGC